MSSPCGETVHSVSVNILLYVTITKTFYNKTYNESCTFTWSPAFSLVSYLLKNLLSHGGVPSHQPAVVERVLHMVVFFCIKNKFGGKSTLALKNFYYQEGAAGAGLVLETNIFI